MFPGLRATISTRFFGVSQFFNEACDLTRNPQSAVASKGLVFVQLYAVYEHAVVNAVLAGLNELLRHGLPISDIRHELLPILLEPEVQSVSGGVGRKKIWVNRTELFRRVFCSDCPVIPAQYFPGDDSHFRRPQLDTIWSLFGLASDPVPAGRHIGLIDELVEHRNAIAHGREVPESIGGRFSAAEIADRIVWTQELCFHIVNELESHCATADNLRRTPGGSVATITAVAP